MATKPLYLNERSHAAADPIRNFRFLVRFYSPSTSMGVKFDAKVGFVAVQGMSVTTEAIPYREGGFNTTVHYLPGQQAFAPITLQRGVTVGSRQHWDWFTKLYDVGWSLDSNAKDNPSGPNGLTGHFRCSVDIDVLAHPQPLIHEFTGNRPETAYDDPVIHRFSLMNAWPTNISYSDLNAADSAVLVEQVTLVHEGMSVRWLNNSGSNTSWTNMKYGNTQF